MNGRPPITLRDLAGIDVGQLKGVGEKKRASLAAVDIHSVLDLVTTYPRRWVDRTNEARIADLVPGDEALVLVAVRSVRRRPTRNRRTIVNVQVGDGTGRMEVVFFNQPWREKQLREGLQVALFGKVDTYRGALQMTNPIVDLIGDRTGRIVAIYPQSEKAQLNTWELAAWVEEALRRCHDRGIADPVPETIRRRLSLVDRGAALSMIHLPETMRDKETARRRLAFDELLRVQLVLVMRKRELERTSRGLAHTVDGELVRRFLAALPFPLTTAQRRTIAEIDGDLASSHPMHRLLQGDVGAGKTIVAVATLLTAVQGGHQGALMAPTEVLAEQHAASVRAVLGDLRVPDPGNLFGDRPLRIELLTNRVTGSERKEVLAGLADGSVDIAIGTHALIQEGVAFHSLGAVVVDEQHRFGVEQRAALREKSSGHVPDVLVMTATPIPRTAAMTVYGDLDVSVLDELPPGRTPIVTRWAEGQVGDSNGSSTTRSPSASRGPSDAGPQGQVGERQSEAEAASSEAKGSGPPATRSPTNTASGPAATRRPIDDVWADVRGEVAAGRQAYVVCPLIEESEKLEVASAEETYQRLATGELSGLSLGLLHGRLTPSEKELTMELFRAGRLDVLVATTVIEVGVDVPNATVMVILDADRFGIAQLHQLRGRVGRGAHASRCWLVTQPSADGAEAGNPRVEALVATSDGFELAEIDLELRGEGTLMSTAQKGRSDLKLASLRRDRELVQLARDAAFEIVDADSDLSRHPLLADELDLLFTEEDEGFLAKS